jgi:signal transduction histidine kinase
MGEVLLAQKYDSWREQSLAPQIIEGLYLIRTDGEAIKAQRFNLAEGRFYEKATTVEATAEIETLKKQLFSLPQQAENDKNDHIIHFSVDLINEEMPALVIPAMDSPAGGGEQLRLEERNSFDSFALGSKSFVVLKLDLKAIRNFLLPELIKRHFPESESRLYNIAVVSRNAPDQVIFQSQAEQRFQPDSEDDATAEIFALNLNKRNYLFLKKDSDPKQPKSTSADVFPRCIKSDKKTISTVSQSEDPTRHQPDASVLNNEEKLKASSSANNFSESSNGRWVLRARHLDGAFENIIDKTRWRNLAISFGILSFLAINVILLVIALRQAQKNAQNQIDFVSSVSHEFRTPIAVICTAGENLADGIVRSDRKIEKYGRLIHRQGQRLGEMVEQLLEFSAGRSGRKKYAFQPVELAALIEDVLADNQLMLEENKFKVEKEIDGELPVVFADRQALGHSLRNLVGNAIKYGNNSDGENWLKISAKVEREHILLTVSDNGIGINARELERIFEPFYRGRRSIEAQIHGSGLGLSLSRQIIEAHKGRIWAESNPGEGSKFTIQIPINSKREAEDDE